MGSKVHAKRQTVFRNMPIIARPLDFHVVYYNFIPRSYEPRRDSGYGSRGIAKNIWTYADLVRMLEARNKNC